MGRFDQLPPDAAALAERLAASGDFGVEPSEEDGFEWEISLFDDVRGWVGDDAIEALPAWLESFDDIREVLHVEREVIWVGGIVSRAGLEARVLARLAQSADPGYWDRDDSAPSER